MDPRKLKHITGRNDWEDKKTKAREQLTGIQASKPPKPNNPVNVDQKKRGTKTAFTEMILPLINTTDWKRKGDNKRKDLRKKAGKRISA